ncbi:MAG TPA: serine/threonine-protein kinase, partial [Longimicrobiales bacterium]|nr:serine/threonine-protein kinase [Longimicrobiales bacterium]
MVDRYDFGPKPVILGKGSRATVYKVTDQQLGRVVALKVFTREDALSDDDLSALASISQVGGANLVGITNQSRINVPGDTRLLHFVAMEYHDGSTLAQDALSRVTWEGAAPEDARAWCADALAVIQQSFAGLQQLHRAEIRHLGIKPSNILVTRDADGRVTEARLLDAGLASIGRGTDRRARALYSAPEQFAGVAVSEAADVYSLGVVSYELLTGRHPFVGVAENAEAMALSRNIATATPTCISDLNPYVHESIALVLHRTLTREPGDRPSSAEVVRLLEAASVDGEARLSANARVGRARELYSRGELQAAAETLHALERAGWVLPQAVALRTRISAELELRRNVLELQQEDVALAEEALSSGHRRQAWYRLELLQARQECDPYGQAAHHGDLARLRTEFQSLRAAEQNWLARVRDLTRAGSFDEAIAECAQIGNTVRPTPAVLAQELEVRAQRHRPLIGNMDRLLNAASQDDRVRFAEAVTGSIHSSPNALTEAFQLL